MEYNTRYEYNSARTRDENRTYELLRVPDGLYFNPPAIILGSPDIFPWKFILKQLKHSNDTIPLISKQLWKNYSSMQPLLVISREM